MSMKVVRGSRRVCRAWRIARYLTCMYLVTVPSFEHSHSD
jgi:hypothetical protein